MKFTPEQDFVLPMRLCAALVIVRRVLHEYSFQIIGAVHWLKSGFQEFCAAG